MIEPAESDARLTPPIPDEKDALQLHGIKRQSLPEEISTALRERILRGEFKEGDQLRQEAIAEEYDVSRMPVREALRQLEASGLVMLRTHKGAVVTVLPLEQIGELFDLRAVLECEILAHAVARMTDADFAGPATSLKRLSEAYRRADMQEYGALNWEFHRGLYAPANRVQTMATIQAINLRTDRYIRLHLLLTGALEEAEIDHREILRLCQERDTQGAVTFLRRHILSAKRHLLGAVEKHHATASG
jgi:DNA-binding GntR family transcriptional regulator